jgi:hypothetical protein
VAAFRGTARLAITNANPPCLPPLLQLCRLPIGHSYAMLLLLQVDAVVSVGIKGRMQLA